MPLQPSPASQKPSSINPKARQGGKYLILTGGSRGFGAALLIEGQAAQVSICHLARHRPATLAAQDFHRSLDLASVSAREQAFAELLEYLRERQPESLYLVHSAGQLQPVGVFHELDCSMIERSLQVNQQAVIHLTHVLFAAFPQLPLRLGILSSGAARNSYRAWSPYCIGKAGIRMLARVLAKEAQWQGLDRRVVLYEPGIMDTDMQKEIRDLAPGQFPDQAKFTQLHAQGQLVDPQHSAQVFWQAFTAEDCPRFVEWRYEQGQLIDLQAQE